MPRNDLELPISIKVAGGVLAGTLHLPAGRAPRRGWPAVLMCHGFTGTRTEAHFLFVKTSRALAGAGIASLRFDFRGSGESSGRFEDMTVLTELSDALAAWDFLGARPGIDASRRAVLGLSFGGAVAALLAGGLAAEGRAPPCAVLWSAVADLAEIWGKRLQQERRRARGKLRFPIERDGHRIGRAFFRDMLRLPPLPGVLASSAVPVLIVHGGADAVVPAAHARAYASACGPAQAKLSLLRGYDHTFARTDRERKVIGITLRWLGRRL
jgi:hypothetical protein